MKRSLIVAVAILIAGCSKPEQQKRSAPMTAGQLVGVWTCESAMNALAAPMRFNVRLAIKEDGTFIEDVALHHRGAISPSLGSWVVSGKWSLASEDSVILEFDNPAPGVPKTLKFPVFADKDGLSFFFPDSGDDQLVPSEAEFRRSAAK